MAVWLVRAGKLGEREDFALENGVAAIGWEELPDLSNLKSREELDALCRKTYLRSKPATISSWVGQLWAFKDRIQVADVVALPLKRHAAIAIGRVAGSYEYQPDFPRDARHSRRVEWLKKDVPRSSFDEDLLYSLGALGTVRRIQRNTKSV